MSNRFTEKAEKALNQAVKVAEEFGHTYIGSEHILLSLCRTQESIAAIILNKFSITKETIYNAVKDYSGMGLKSSLNPKDMTPCSKKIVENAYRISVRYGCSKIGTEHILLSLLEEKDSVAVKLLSYCKADIAGITDEIQTLLRTAEKNQTSKRDGRDAATSSPIKQHGRSLTLMARQGKLDPVIGRSKETDRLIRTLCRKNKNNPCLIGEAGVGKTAIVEGLAQRIAENDVPPALRGKEIISVDLTSMVSGTKYRGDFEERIKSVINEAASNKSIILFIDEIHTIVGAGAAEGAIDAANILKPQLSRGEIQLIGATTFAEYHKYIEKDAALERRFQPITVNESTPEETLTIIQGLRGRYEAHHGVKISDEAIKACVKFSDRYIQDRFLPDKALDILDEACAKARTSVGTKINIFDENIRQLGIEKDEAIKSGDFVLAKNLHELEMAFEKEKPPFESITLLEDEICVSEQDVKEIINEITGIPLVGIGEKVNKEQIVEALSRRVIGQDEAVRTLADAILRSETGIGTPDKPKGIFLFVGSSGVGKTELANAMSEALFFDKSSFFKYDMSEFSESNTTTKLIGAPPGYVGHEDGGAMTEKVRRHPYSILLFDEIERAHPEILDLFLQIADNGVLTDGSGKSVSFRNTYIIFTSGAASEALCSSAPGFIKNGTLPCRERVLEALSKRFKSDFLNRIDEIIFFPPIENDDMVKIVRTKLSELRERLCGMGIDAEFSNDLAEFIVAGGNNKKFGVREILRKIANAVETPLSKFINENQIEQNPIIISIYGGSVKIEFKRLPIADGIG